MRKPTTDPDNVQMSDVLCDFCRREWTDDLPIVEGHQGSIICGFCLSTAYRTVMLNKMNTAPEGYKTLASLRAAGVKADAGDLPGAVALWNGVAADSGAVRSVPATGIDARGQAHGKPARLERPAVAAVVHGAIGVDGQERIAAVEVDIDAATATDRARGA